MPKFNPKNERIKHRYLNFLAEARQLSVATVDQIAAAISDFDQGTGHRDFALFRPEQAQSYKHRLAKATNPATNRPLAKATMSSRLAALKAFLQWLSHEPGFRRLNYSDAEYFNLSGNDERIAKAVRERPSPTIEQIRHVLQVMPAITVHERRNRTLIAFAILTGARDDAIASMSLKHVDIDRQQLHQDAREVRTKNAKTMTTGFFPVGNDIQAIVSDWISFLRTELFWGDDDPLFPPSKVSVGDSGQFENSGLAREHWKSAAAIREIFRNGFALAGLPYFNPHSFRKTLVLYGYKKCAGDLEAFKVWSQTLGHAQMLTTLTSYGTVPPERQAQILKAQWMDGPRSVASLPQSEADAVQSALAHLVNAIRKTE